MGRGGLNSRLNFPGGGPIRSAWPGAARLGRVIGEDAGLLVAAATLHDVGYASRLAATGFHPLDGARFFRDEYGAAERLVRLVANHSFALVEAEERGLREVLGADFPLLKEPILVDALVYCDMTTTPNGGRTTARDRSDALSMTRRMQSAVQGKAASTASPTTHGGNGCSRGALDASPWS
ncbi:HD domain-containing protein [Streptomyces shenzhenensis]|uniref:HD domain-containing protein n=1 Tax=Streptomyces shenzhenensis TaxID=943815 RepID=UPI0036AB1C74